LAHLKDTPQLIDSWVSDHICRIRWRELDDMWCAAGATPYNLFCDALIGAIKRNKQMLMPVMDHRVVEGMRIGDKGWITRQSLQILNTNIVHINEKAHVYPTRRDGVNVQIDRLKNGLFIEDYGSDTNGGCFIYYPQWDVVKPLHQR
jgi:hypothetical protein